MRGLDSFQSPEFTGETMDCLKAICRGQPDQVRGLSDESRYLIQWRILNESAFEAGKWQDAKPLSQEIVYFGPGDDPFIPPEKTWNRENQPPFGSPAWEIPETFEAWSARIVDPKRRNLDFVVLSWDGSKVIEHPAVSLDPKARPTVMNDRQSRKIPAPGKSPDSADVISGRKVIFWGIVAAASMVAVSIAWWLKRHFAGLA